MKYKIFEKIYTCNKKEYKIFLLRDFILTRNNVNELKTFINEIKQYQGKKYIDIQHCVLNSYNIETTRLIKELFDLQDQFDLRLAILNKEVIL